MNYGKIIYCDTANGIGCRTVLFVSGCTHHCKGCFNDMAWPFNYGKEYTKETENKILESLKPDYIIRLDNILQNIDVLVDGEFQEDKKNIMLEFRGSENQRVIDVKKTLETGEVVLLKL